MRHIMRIIGGALLALAVTTAGGQEIRLEDSGDVRITGTMHYVAPDENRIVVNDMTYSLGRVVWINGTLQRVERLTELLNRNETVELELSEESGNGYPRVTRIHTNP